MSQPTMEFLRQPLGVRHALLVFVSPRALFSRLEESGAYGWPLVTLLGLVILLGYAEIQTGLIDNDVDVRIERRLEELEKTQGGLIDQVELRDRMEALRKESQFMKILARLGVIGLTPLYMLGSFLLIASLLYAVVALTGRKPEFHTLLSICVYAGFVELTALALRLAMILFYRTTNVDTTLAALGEAGPGGHIGLLGSICAAIDPFHLWFWGLIAVGLTATQQLGPKLATALCCFCALVGVAARTGLVYATA